MKTATIKITALFFSLLGLAPLLFIILTSIKQQEIRHSMQQQLEIKMLQTITLSKNDVNWLNVGKEILVNGRMFDVKSFHSAGNGTTSFTGLYDDDETALVNKVKENQQTDNNAGGKLLIQLFQFLQSSCNNSQIEVFVPSLLSNPFPGIQQSLASQYITILSPPPQV